MLDEDIARFLLSPPGRTLLDQAMARRDESEEPVRALDRLRRGASPAQAAAAWEMAGLRRRAAVKFGAEAARMYFVREALEQASGSRAAAYHAGRFAAAGLRHVADLCGGIGGDALALAGAGLRVTLWERDPVRALFARENARVHGLSGRIDVLTADVTQSPIAAEAAWFDPARRSAGGGRVSDPDLYVPPLSWLARLEEQGVPHWGAKLSPAVDHAAGSGRQAELEFLSDGGECKEALLWQGALRSGDPVRATVLTASGPVWLAGDARAPVGTGEGRVLYEPDPAVIRAHLVGTLAARLDAALLDPQIAYLVGGRLAETPFATAYQVEERFPFGRKRLQERLAAHGVGQVVIKKRGFPQEPDALRKQLTLRGPHTMTVVIARVGKGHQVFLCRPV